jgi:S-DNA-T family DNA segregation ATPase FtsK/SpoIIIE
MARTSSKPSSNGRRSAGRAAASSKSRATAAETRSGRADARAKGTGDKGGGSGQSREIWGIVIAAVSVALVIALLTGDAGHVSSAVDGVAAALRLGFGYGAFLVPVAGLAWAATFFLGDRGPQQGRAGLGLLIIFVSLITMLALWATPEGRQFTQPFVTDRGGWVGGGIAWALRTPFKVPISYVFAAAALLVGLILAGLSITKIVESARAGYASRRDAMRAADAAYAGRAGAAPMSGRTVPLDRAVSAGGGDGTVPAVVDGAPESAEPRGSRRRKSDPEVARPTVPAFTAVAPRAMEGYELPPLAMLTHSPANSAGHKTTDKELRENAAKIERTLGTFDIPARVVGWTPGPTVTLFRISIEAGIKVNRVTTLSDDLALALAAPTIRILAPIPGESLIGIEVPNERRSTVTLGDVLSTGQLANPSPLLLAIGKDVSGESIIEDLASMPHLLIAGATGTGKSVCINAVLTSILMRATPSEVRLILIDPKRIELAAYNGLSHLYVPVVTEPKQAASALHWAVAEMEARLKRLQSAGARNIAEYNAIALDPKKNPEDELEPMPYLVIVIDELADLMMVAAREVEDSIVRIAQLARAAGIHLVVATQRPSTDIITGLIKANITNRIAFRVGSSIDSRVILDQPGAEKLVGQGDLLFLRPEWAKPKRIQGAFVSLEETREVVEHVRGQAEPDYHEEILTLPTGDRGGSGGGGDDDDPLIWEAGDIVVTSGLGSTSMLQRRLSVGYARAGRIMDMLEAKGVVGPPNGSKPRDVLVDVEELESIKAFERQEADGT